MRRIQLLVTSFLLTTAATVYSQPVNDLCTSAVDVLEGLDVTVTSALAGPWNTTGATIGAEVPNCAGSNGAGVWCSFTSPSDSIWQFDTNGTNDDTGLSIWDSCGGSQIVCNDDGGAGLSSLVTVPVATGTTVYILLHHYFSNAAPITTGVLNIANVGPIPPPVTNDSCAAASILDTSGTAVVFTTAGATNSADSSCGDPGELDVWFELTVADDDVIALSADILNGGGDIDLSVTAGCGGAEIACSDVGFSTSESTAVSVLAGDVIAIRVGTSAFNGVNGEISATSLGDLTGQHVIVAGELATGIVDSVAAIEAALVANGIPNSTIRVLPAVLLSGSTANLSAPASLWVQCGTYPADLDIPDEAPGLDVLVKDFVLAGVPTYISGGDNWGFNGVGVIADIDGVDDTIAPGTGIDGDDSHQGMDGLGFMSGFDNLYTQDQGGNDYTDRLAPADGMLTPGGDTLGVDSAAIWADDASGGNTTGYITGVGYTTADIGGATGVEPGNVISTASEFGGLYQGDAANQALVMAEYLSFLDVNGAGGVQFIRGDVDESGTYGISDAVSLLGVLFVVGAPVPGCLATADVNGDGALGLSDAIGLLQFLFLNGTPPVAPYPDCGSDSIGSGIGCTADNQNCLP